MDGWGILLDIEDLLPVGETVRYAQHLPSETEAD